MSRIFTIAALAIAAMTSAAEAQSIVYTPNDRTVTITGTNLADTVYVENYWAFGEKVDIELTYWNAAEGEWDDIDEKFDADEVDTIIFYGLDGDDFFECEDDDDILADCILIGGDGLDTLIGGPNNDYIDGGYDGHEDIMEGRLGSDTFVRWYELEQRPFTGFPGRPTVVLPAPWIRLIAVPRITHIWVRVYEYETVLDFNSAEGDVYDLREAP